ncbi:hemolymph lipopolysaccharide-binding protein-like [Hylaeus anthracinus]|uniref:hemolymph lipopolysaccharide-binding protein-like n=1 Tax=Hylaeus anthracinus TaxID=313031 RepID=UPI0023B9936B|nr:hemolymph lipopolysaccharide-binding protein-like [Hylaeus anthracinus]XP_054001328.1 hemolymph lipopolysaccharide-binding protein-like [Hylaeus anthracinus]
MFKLTVIVLAFLNGMLSDVASVTGETYDSGRSSADSVQCQNNYDADKQSFFVNGRQRGTPNDAKMKEGYTITRGIGAHKLFNKRLKWNAARQTCMRDGGYLAIINSVAEESVLLRYMEQQNIAEAWLGIHDLFEEGDWVTLTGESLEEAGFDKWTTAFANEPDNYGGNQNCGVLVKASGLDDVVCTLHHFYICEIDVV